MPAAERIKQVRRELGWTQAQLAEALGVSVWTVRGWEQARVEGSKAREAPPYLELALLYLLSNK
jgi:DNA-binding transcriptional regulator YiaG